MLARATPLAICLCMSWYAAASPPAAHEHASHDHDSHHDPAAAASAPDELRRQQWQLEQLAAAVERYKDVKTAEREGWVRFGGEDPPLMGEHWYRKGAREPLPGEPLNLSEPTTLQYAVVEDERVLVGVSYNIRIAPGDPLPEGFAGDEDHWHIHDVEKILSAATEERPFLGWLAKAWIDREYRSKGDHRSRMAMVHAWVVVPNPDGVFAMHNRVIPYLRVGLPVAYAQGGDDAAASGVNLAAPKACANSLDGGLWIAKATRAQRKALHAKCAELAARVQQVLASGAGPGAINEAGKEAWLALEVAKRKELTGRQLDRIATLTEH